MFLRFVSVLLLLGFLSSCYIKSDFIYSEPSVPNPQDPLSCWTENCAFENDPEALLQVFVETNGENLDFFHLQRDIFSEIETPAFGMGGYYHSYITFFNDFEEKILTLRLRIEGIHQSLLDILKNDENASSFLLSLGYELDLLFRVSGRLSSEVENIAYLRSQYEYSFLSLVEFQVELEKFITFYEMESSVYADSLQRYQELVLEALDLTLPRSMW